MDHFSVSTDNSKSGTLKTALCAAVKFRVILLQ
jgi:hypothetical protein